MFLHIPEAQQSADSPSVLRFQDLLVSGHGSGPCSGNLLQVCHYLM